LESNLFQSLFKYKSTPGKNPLEDYFTEQVGFLFNFDKQLASEWLKYILNREPSPDPKGMRIFTQYSLGVYGRADLAFDWTENGQKKSLVVEHKIGSSIGERGLEESGEVKTQVTNYLHYQRRRGDAGNHLVAVFKVSALPILTSHCHSSPYFLGEFPWDKLYNFLRKFIENKSESVGRAVTRFLCEGITAFMRRCNMVLENFTVQEVASLSPHTEFMKKASKLTERIGAAFRTPPEDVKKILEFSSPVWGEDKVGKHFGLVLHGKKKRDESHIWVHVGFSMLCEEYRPWLEYWPQTILKDQSIPDVQVMLALYPEDENIENAKKIHGNILDRLNAHLKTGSKSIDKFEMIETKKSLSFYFRKPLSDFLKFEDQESEVITFWEIGLNAVNGLAGDGSLLKITEDKNYKD
jgi:hypothetical protein